MTETQIDQSDPVFAVTRQLSLLLVLFLAESTASRTKQQILQANNWQHG